MSANSLVRKKDVYLRDILIILHEDFTLKKMWENRVKKLCNVTKKCNVTFPEGNNGQTYVV